MQGVEILLSKLVSINLFHFHALLCVEYSCMLDFPSYACVCEFLMIKSSACVDNV